ncbi:hypothetical protein HLB44_34795 [Aquincola sp. S2]|uniref:Uncharacterized protein n=1 Tax=Pseudaquabacterium terrae TaxID=2732868 RepID=A0ABX2ETT6_9BURK|nr:hypothetical protein [Aquabacterium terrae]NRF72165.1 hypothetical protein [Aquabacterium terrae]
MEQDLASPRCAERCVRLPLSPDDLAVILCILRHGPAARVEFETERTMAQAVEEALAAGLRVIPTPTLATRAG